MAADDGGAGAGWIAAIGAIGAVVVGGLVKLRPVLTAWLARPRPDARLADEFLERTRHDAEQIENLNATVRRLREERHALANQVQALQLETDMLKRRLDPPG